MNLRQLIMDNFIVFTTTSILLVLSPGPGNLLAMARGVSQGPRAACVSAFASACGVLVHVVAASMGLTAVLMASDAGFFVTKVCGAVYLGWLGIRAMIQRSLVTFDEVDHCALVENIRSGFLTAALSPKIALFILAFVPQFVDENSPQPAFEVAVYGSWFAVLTAVIFSTMGATASVLVETLKSRPQVVTIINLGAGGALLAAGLSLAVTVR